MKKTDTAESTTGARKITSCLQVTEELVVPPANVGLSPEVWVTGVLSTAAVIEDLARRRISNWIPFCALSAFLVFMIFYLPGGMGGGDIKLMAGFGAVLGYSQLFEAAL